MSAPYKPPTDWDRRKQKLRDLAEPTPNKIAGCLALAYVFYYLALYKAMTP